MHAHAVAPPAPQRRIRRPARALPPEVAVAEAFVHLTGLDPTSVWGTQSPPPRQRPASFGAAAADPDDPTKRPSLWQRACQGARRAVRQAASWLYHRAVGFCLG